MLFQFRSETSLIYFSSNLEVIFYETKQLHLSMLIFHLKNYSYNVLENHLQYAVACLLSYLVTVWFSLLLDPLLYSLHQHFNNPM